MPDIRADIVDVYLFRHGSRSLEFLQLLRSGSAVEGWHPIMGHLEPGETALACASREMLEEVGLARDDEHLLGVWALEQVHPYFVPQLDAVILSPRFCAGVSPEWDPKLNREHAAFRWIPAAEASTAFLWPGQRAVIREIEELLNNRAVLDALRVNP